MIKFRDLGTFKTAKLSPVLTSTSEVSNYSFLTDDGITYLVCQEANGDDSYREDLTFSSGSKLRGFDLRSLLGKALVCDKKHITFGDGETYASSLTANTTLLKIKSDGTLEITASAPSSGYYFKVIRKLRLTEEAVELKVLGSDYVADCTLSALSIGSLTLSPTFAAGTTTYTANTSNNTNTLSFTKSDTDATTVVKLNGTTLSNMTCTWTQNSANTLTIEVTNGTATKTYTVTVTHASGE